MKQILVTGASTGIGFDLTKRLCEKGHRVWAGVRRPEVLQSLQSRYPELLTVLKLDVVNEQDIQNAFTTVTETWDRHREFILVNNAGVAIGGPIEALPLKEWRDLFAVNVFAPVRLTQIFLPLLRETRGRVVNVGSISGQISTPFLSPYCSSKFALRSFNDSLRREMMPFAVKVILIEAGPVRTEIWSKSISHSEDRQREMSEEMRKVYGPQLEALKEGVSETVKTAIPVETVTEVMLQSIESPRPDRYYLLGKNVKLFAAMGRFLPAALIDRLMGRGFRMRRI
ncbi:SDR family oxidoreductase [Bdellovibrio sp. ArHS]|uniref:SDR family oxidoreductase n=1 Tax=Bdellovibrio sp. ArHS TaxID=1569284 RepID=UPI000A3F7B53|nr:SDR family oxidoreductase [Bdellovibrio sp. ArHS]